MIQLTYTSEPAEGITASEVLQIVKAARSRNLERGISGCLLFRHDLFVQVLEGEAIEAIQLLTRIARDPRHGNLRICGCVDIEQRVFQDWSMGLFLLTRENLAAVEAASGKRSDQITDLDHGELVELLDALTAP